MQTKIKVRTDETRLPNGYLALISRPGCPGVECIGNSPDEALGAAVRELWLSQREHADTVHFILEMEEQ